MKIKSDTDLHVSTTWGASIFLQAGEEREVGDDLGYQALQQGASEVRDEPKAAPKRRRKAPAKAKVVTEDDSITTSDTSDVKEDKSE